jgi:hypothetical protein
MTAPEIDDACACAFLSEYSYDKLDTPPNAHVSRSQYAWKWQSVSETLSDWTRFSCENSDAQCLFCFRESDKTVFLVFRGTDSWKDALIDVSLMKRRPAFIADVPSCKVHAGFLRQFKACEGGIGRYLNRHTDRKRTVATGHSLGGALAILCSVYVGRQLKERSVECVSFGAPRVGNRVFSEIADSVASITRVVVGYDPVASLPTRARWKHAGKSAWYLNGVPIKQNYRGDTIWNLIAIPNFLRVKDHSMSGYIDSVAASSDPSPWWKAEATGIYMAALATVGAAAVWSSVRTA